MQDHVPGINKYKTIELIIYFNFDWSQIGTAIPRLFYSKLLITLA